MIKKYQKKPFRVEAMQLLSGSKQDLLDWLGSACYSHVQGELKVVVITPTGTQLAVDGSFIVLELLGFYVLAPETFANLYEEIK